MRVVAVVTVALAGCANAGQAPSYSPEDLARRPDGAGRRDLGATDLAALDLAADFSIPSDLAAADDLAVAALDATVTSDLSVESDSLPVSDLSLAADLRPAPDFAVSPDFAAASDLTSAVDLTPSPDLAQPCDVVRQDCPPNDKCTLGSNLTPVCVPAGTVGTAQSCLTGSCVVGDICIIESSRIPLNLCFPFCRVDADCSNGGHCDVQIGNFRVCTEPLTNCDPVAMSGCASGGCYVVTSDGLTGCHPAGTGVQAAPCDTDYDCAAGFICLSPGNCSRLCNTTADCPMATTCNGRLTGTQRKLCI